MDYLAQMKKAVEATHGCTATHEATDAIRELFKGQVIWEGEVETFALKGHPKAKRAYAWGYPKEDKGPGWEFVTVLEVPPVTSALTAVKIAIAAQAKRQS